MNRALVFAGIGAVALTAVLIVALRGGGDDKAAANSAPEKLAKTDDQGTSPVRMKAPNTAGRTTPNRPKPRVETASPLSASFEGQERDESWANENEREIGQRIETLLEKYRDTVSVPRAECRQNVCRVAITGTDELHFRQFVESLQDERGFYGYADQLMLEKPQSSAGGMSIRVFLVFNR
jgi:hypothetical protein